MSEIEFAEIRLNDGDGNDYINFYVNGATHSYLLEEVFEQMNSKTTIAAELEALRQERDALSKAVEYLASVFSNANTAEEFMPIVIKNLKIAGRDDIADGLVMSGFAASLKATK